MKNLFNKLSALFLGVFLLISGSLVSCNKQLGIVYSNESLKEFYEDSNITLSQENDDAWTVLNEYQIKGNISGGSFNKSRNSTLLFTYHGETSIDIYFDYKVNLGNNGVLKIENEVIAKASGEYSVTLNKNEDFAIYVESGSGKDSVLSLELNNIFLKEETISKINLTTVDNGSYSININDELVDVNENKEFSVSSREFFTLKAKNTNVNFEFYAWEFNNQIVSKENPYSTTISENTTIKPIFMSNEIALFSNNGEVFADLNEAISNAENNDDKVIVLYRNGYIESGNYKILNGMTLYIPNDYAVNIFRDDKVIVKGNEPLSEFRRLILKDNVTLTAENGATLYVAGTGSGNFTGSGCGGYGHIYLEGENSIINIENGADLYCYGYISGNGVVNANSGSNIYELFQMTSWRGGTATTTMLNNEQKVFVINQYYVQNIEAKFRIFSGSNVTVRTGVVVLSMFLSPASCTFIGNNGVFKIEEGYLERVYDYNNDRITYSINGKVTVSSIYLTISVAGISIDSSSYILPITNNLTINVLSGSQIVIEQDLALLPGVILNIEEGASMRFKENASLFVYDNDNWYNQKYAGINSDIIQVRYVASLNGAPVSRKSESTTMDATINLNGDAYIENGGCIYTTLGKLIDGVYSGGASIYSSNGSGKIHFVTELGSLKSTFQVKQNNTDITYDEIPIDTAYLKNDDGSYFIPSSFGSEIVGKTIGYDLTKGQWKII